MGHGYIDINSKGERLPVTGKADFLIADGATELSMLPHVPDPCLVAVVENGHFDAACICDEQYRVDRAHNAIAAGDPRPVRFLSYPHAQATVTRTTVAPPLRVLKLEDMPECEDAAQWKEGLVPCIGDKLEGRTIVDFKLVSCEWLKEQAAQGNVSLSALLNGNLHPKNPDIMHVMKFSEEAY